MSSTLLIRKRFQGYLCESGIAIFARKVTLNNGYSPFNAEDTGLIPSRTQIKNAKFNCYCIF